ncbi:hypothetical protein QF000_007105 [Paraburkholderia atlantica]
MNGRMPRAELRALAVKASVSIKHSESSAAPTKTPAMRDDIGCRKRG